MRTGVIAKKLGMSRYYTDDGFHIPVTLLKLEECQVVAVKTEELDGYNAVQLGSGSVKVKNVSKPLRGHFAKVKVKPKRKLAEFRVSSSALLKAGQQVIASHFVSGQFVDVSGISKGKGFAGGMKRHNFGGLEATHGVSISHRSHGSTGQCQDPGRVFKGKKMAGHLGDVRKTVQNLEVIAVDEENDVLLINGAVPGAKGSFVTVSDAVKKNLPLSAPLPAGLKSAVTANDDKSVNEDVAASEDSNNDKQQGE